ncbi:Uma2 family endonuclease [Streptomyces sp. TRM 70361]|uniref:Uma2 family endonuclease n=1 Tax=Streptomyces sp. TRM 70361 TaxID=3116553 RepID=UPI002E7B9ADF|nr:Uma2 family endonuclease [Streptomyces sp. TRM 70361]MEE1941592.1 Uma2 family endonuclease [Streptomyces sp. TRM 70361]
MTVELTDRIEMTDSSEPSLDELFELLERMPVPEGYKAEIVEGTVHMTPQRDTHWEIIAALYDHLRSRHPRNRLKSDVRIDFPGPSNGFAPDMVLLAEGARQTGRGRWRYQDIQFVAEVISEATRHNDYGKKCEAYAAAGVPSYLIVDPYTARCHLFTHPKDGEYRSHLAVGFGEVLDLGDTPVGLVLPTDEFPRERGSADDDR